MGKSLGMRGEHCHQPHLVRVQGTCWDTQPPSQELLPGSRPGGPQTQTHGESGTLFICHVPSVCPAVMGAET